jgi:hypothetical protein
MRMIKRYNLELNAWEIGFYRGTTFVIIDIVRVLEDAKRLYDEVA